MLHTLRNHGFDLVKYIVARDFLSAMEFYERDDLIGYGMIGLVRALKQYDGEHNFVNFACKKISQSILDFIRRKCRRRFVGYEINEFIRNVEIIQNWKSRPWYGPELIDLERFHCKRFPLPSSVVAARDSFQYLIAGLNKDRKWLMRQLFIKNLNWQEIKQIKGWSKWKIFNERKMALQQIRSRLNTDHYTHGNRNN